MTDFPTDLPPDLSSPADLPAYFPRTSEELAAWRRNKTIRTINEEADALHAELVLVDQVYARLCSAGDNDEAVTGKVTLDDILCAERGWNYAKTAEGRKHYPRHFTARFDAVLRAHRVAKKRAGMSREDMRNRAERAGGPPD